MKRGKASRTAEIAAAVRARHHLYDRPVILEDPFAIEFTSPLWRKIVTSKPLRRFFLDGFLRSQRPIAAQVVGRSRYAEDLLEEAIAAGTRQYVIVGAGFDSFALRRHDLASVVRVFELDHPDTQRAKIERVRRVSPDLPANLEFVAIDFEKRTVADVLAESGYRAAEPGFFAWLGTTMYLSRPATLGTLEAIARFAAPGSQVVFDYLVPSEVLSDSDRRIVDTLKRFTARRGEPLIGEFRPDELKEVLDSVGLELIENLSGAEQEKRYFAGRADGFKPLAASYFARARVARGPS